MAKSVIKMVYIAAQYRVRVEIFPSQFEEFSSPPSDMFKRAKRKISEEKKNGNIVYFEFYEEKLRKIWKIIRKGEIELSRPLSFTLAVGCPALSGIKIEPLADGPFIGYLELGASPEQINTWRYQLISVYVRYLLREERISELPDPTFIQRACSLRGEGALVRAFPLYRYPVQPEQQNHLFQITKNERHGMVNVVLHEINEGIDDKIIKQVIRAVNQDANFLEEEFGYRYQIERAAIVRRIRSAGRGPERYGFDMPLTILGAFQTTERLPVRQRFKADKPVKTEKTIGSPVKVKIPDQPLADFMDPVAGQNNQGLVIRGAAGKPTKTASGRPASANASSSSPETPESTTSEQAVEAEVVPEPKVNLHKYIQIEVTPDKLAATIEKFDTSIYEMDVKITKAQWLKFIESRSVVFGVDKPYADLVLKNWRKKKDLTGMKIAQGEPCIKAETPFLYSTFKHKQEGTYREPGAPKPSASAAETERLTPMLFAAVGDVVAEVRYEVLPEDGVNVFGKKIDPPTASTVVVTVGDGVKVANNLYIATLNGIPKVDGQSVAVEKALVIEGDVSMSTGDIDFEGPVKVTGNVEEGTVIRVDGDLTVEGRISGGQITVTGNIVAAEGIVPAPGSSVRVGGNVEAEFIQSAVFQCGGYIKVLKSIMNSNLLAMKNIAVIEDEGVISGGSYTCGEGLSTYNLGLTMGTKTEFFVGSDIKAERSFWLRSKRTDSLKFLLEQSDSSFKTLNQTPVAKLNKEQKAKKIELKKQVKKLKILVAKSNEHASKAKANLNYNKKAVVEIRGTMSSNCEIILGGVTIQNHEDMMGVRLKIGAGKRNMEPLAEPAPDGANKDEKAA